MDLSVFLSLYQSFDHSIYVCDYGSIDGSVSLDMYIYTTVRSVQVI